MLARTLKDDPLIQKIEDLASQQSIRFQRTDPEDLNRFSPGFFNHQGVILQLSQPPLYLSWDELLHQTENKEKALLVALDSLSDHQNIGSIARTASAFGVNAMVAAQDRQAPLIHPTVWRIAQGAAEHLEFCEVVNLTRSLNELKEKGFWVIGAQASSSAKDVTQVKEWPKKLVLVLGSEEKGLRRLVAETCDELIRIPQEQKGGLESLNVSHAAAILLWEIYKNHGQGRL